MKGGAPMLRRTFWFCVASAIGLSSCAQGGATPDVKAPPNAQTATGPTTQHPSGTGQDQKADMDSGTTSGADAASPPKPGTPPTTQDLIKVVLGIQGKVGKLSALEKTLGLDFQYNANKASTDIQIQDGTQSVTLSLLLEPAPRIVTGAWGRSEPDRNFDPGVLMMRIQSKADIAPPVSRADKEILAVGSDKREVWAWGRFFYYYPKQDADWILEWQKNREDFHHNAADIAKLRDVLTAVAKAMGKGFSFSSYFAKNHAAAQHAEVFDFRSAEVFVEENTMEVHFLNETQIDGFFKALGIQKISFEFLSDVGHRPVPVQAKGCEVTVSSGTWPDDAKRSGPERNGPASTLRVKAMSIDCG
jgi:hypothetical protein